MSLANPATGSTRELLRRSALLGLAAGAVNLLVLVVGGALGATFAVAGPSSTPMQVGVGAVLVATVASLVAGVAAAVLLLVRRAPRGLRVLQLVGGAFAVLSVLSPAVASTDLVTKVALSVMHLVVGAAFVIALQPFASGARRRAVSHGGE